MILNDEITRELAVDGLTLYPYNAIYTDLKRLPEIIHTHKQAEQMTVLLDGCQTNYRLRSCIPDGISVVDEPSAVQLMKARKNSVECENERNAHIKDGVAVTNLSTGLSIISEQKRSRSFRQQRSWSLFEKSKRGISSRALKRYLHMVHMARSYIMNRQRRQMSN